jgi:hypothetical protein
MTKCKAIVKVTSLRENICTKKENSISNNIYLCTSYNKNNALRNLGVAALH